MSARTPDFYIGISTQNPPTIISIGQTIDGMEEVEVRLDQTDEDKLNMFKAKIDKIVAPPVPVVVAPVEESIVAQVEESVVAPVVAPVVAQVEPAPAVEAQVVAPVEEPTPTVSTEVVAPTSLQIGYGKKTKRRKNKRRLTKRRKTKRSKSNK